MDIASLAATAAANNSGTDDLRLLSPPSHTPPSPSPSSTAESATDIALSAFAWTAFLVVFAVVIGGFGMCCYRIHESNVYAAEHPWKAVDLAAVGKASKARQKAQKAAEKAARKRAKEREQARAAGLPDGTSPESSDGEEGEELLPFPPAPPSPGRQRTERDLDEEEWLGYFARIMSFSRWPSPLATLLRQTSRPQPFSPSYTRSLCSTSTRTTNSSSGHFLRSYRLAVALSLPAGALALSALESAGRQPLDCASDRVYAERPPFDPAVGGEPSKPAPKEAESILNLRDLGFGTVSGICCGIFVKKGLKMAAFILGGAFVFLQYMSSRSLITVNWSALSSSYDRFITKCAGPPSSQGGNRVQGLWSWFIDFVAANIQQRATFVAGVALGFRLG
ncbi:hypothetical protein JCM10213_009202 [Rhodosporidiobolus nylandii]